MATEIEAREKEAKIRSQLRTMATPPRAAQPTCLSVSLPRSDPVKAQTTSSVAAPKTQRQNSSSNDRLPGVDDEPADGSGDQHGRHHLERAGDFVVHAEWGFGRVASARIVASGPTPAANLYFAARQTVCLC